MVSAGQPRRRYGAKTPPPKLQALEQSQDSVSSAEVAIGRIGDVACCWPLFGKHYNRLGSLLNFSISSTSRGLCLFVSWLSTKQASQPLIAQEKSGLHAFESKS